MATKQAVGRSFPSFISARFSENAILIGVLGVMVVIAAATLPTYPDLTQFRPEALRALPNVLAPLIVIALFVERAVEVALSAWRQGGARIKQTEFRRAMAVGDVDEQWAAKHGLEAYSSQSQRMAIAVAFMLSLLISMMGVRAIEMLVTQDLVHDAPLAQRTIFVRVDILITALLLTGGAEGIHKVVTAFTTFMDATKERLEASTLPTASDSPMGQTLPSEEGGLR